MNNEKTHNKNFKLIISLIAAVGIFAVGLVTIPSVILVASGIADVYAGITPLCSIPIVASVVIVAITWSALVSPFFPFNFVTGKWPVGLSVFQHIKWFMWNRARVLHGSPSSGEMNFFESSRRIAILRRGVSAGSRAKSHASDDEAKHGTDAITGRSKSFAATSR